MDQDIDWTLMGFNQPYLPDSLDFIQGTVENVISSSNISGGGIGGNEWNERTLRSASLMFSAVASLTNDENCDSANISPDINKILSALHWTTENWLYNGPEIRSAKIHHTMAVLGAVVCESQLSKSSIVGALAVDPVVIKACQTINRSLTALGADPERVLGGGDATEVYKSLVGISVSTSQPVVAGYEEYFSAGETVHNDLEAEFEHSKDGTLEEAGEDLVMPEHTERKPVAGLSRPQTPAEPETALGGDDVTEVHKSSTAENMVRNDSETMFECPQNDQHEEAGVDLVMPGHPERTPIVQEKESRTLRTSARLGSRPKQPDYAVKNYARFKQITKIRRSKVKSSGLRASRATWPRGGQASQQ
ncbi:hypothetical protein Q7P37_009753 [Cladosporium fusiforme]